MSGLLQMSGGRLFQSLAVLGKNEYLCTFILERSLEWVYLQNDGLHLNTQNYTLKS